jgi:hypothetical protein
MTLGVDRRLSGRNPTGRSYVRCVYCYCVRPRASSETLRTSGKLMRILQRQADGAWKIHRTISTVDPSS